MLVTCPWMTPHHRQSPRQQLPRQQRTLFWFPAMVYHHIMMEARRVLPLISNVEPPQWKVLAPCTHHQQQPLDLLIWVAVVENVHFRASMVWELDQSIVIQLLTICWIRHEVHNYRWGHHISHRENTGWKCTLPSSMVGIRCLTLCIASLPRDTLNRHSMYDSYVCVKWQCGDSISMMMKLVWR